MPAGVYMERKRSRIPGIRPIIMLLIASVCLTGLVSAYEISISAPTRLQVGLPLVVNGTSTLPAGISVDIVLYRSDYTTEEIARHTVTIQGDKEFNVVFDTKGLQKGQYKVEVPEIGSYSYLGGSTTLRVVELIDRTDEIIIKSDLTQVFDGSLEIEGSIKDLINSGVQIEVVSLDNKVISGPEYVTTSMEGSFSQKVAITEPGIYEVSFTDSKGYIGTKTFTVKEKPATLIPTTIPTTAPPSLAATAVASVEKPAYFAVGTGAGQVRIYTSPGIDWIIEYGDERGVMQKVNDKGKIEGEETTIQGTGDIIYVKVYPYRMTDKGEVTLSAEGAESVEVSTTVPDVFAGTPTPSPTTPLPVALVLVALAAMGLLALIRRR
jgi:hypothetical protein